MKRLSNTLLAGLLLSFCSPLTYGQTNGASTPPQGYHKVVVEGAGDSHVALPLLKDAMLLAKVSSVGSNFVTVTGAPFVTGSFDPLQDGVIHPYRVEVISGNLKGVSWKIAGNSTDRVIVEAEGFAPDNHPMGLLVSGDMVAIRPAWTIGEVFGEGASAGALGAFDTPPGVDELSLSDTVEVWRGQTSRAICYKLSGQGWREVARQNQDSSIRTIDRSDVLKVRKIGEDAHVFLLLGNAPAPSGHVFQTVVSIPGEPLMVSYQGADAVAVEDSGIETVMGVSENLFNRTDELALFSADQRGFDQEPERVFVRTGAHEWKEAGVEGVLPPGTLVFQPGQPLLIRSSSGMTNGVVIWRQQPPSQP